MINREEICLGHFSKRVDLDINELESINMGDYVRKLIEYHVEKCDEDIRIQNKEIIEKVQAYVLIPKKVNQKLPGIIAIHHHNSNWKIGKSVFQTPPWKIGKIGNHPTSLHLWQDITPLRALGNFNFPQLRGKLIFHAKRLVFCPSNPANPPTRICAFSARQCAFSTRQCAWSARRRNCSRTRRCTGRGSPRSLRRKRRG